jgi:cohesin loading factor subunit SCC2
LAYIAVPPKPWLTPSSSLKGSHKQLGKMTINDTPDDLGSYSTEDEDGAYSPIHTNLNNTVKSSVRRTGDRDEHRMFLFYIDPQLVP